MLGKTSTTTWTKDQTHVQRKNTFYSDLD